MNWLLLLFVLWMLWSPLIVLLVSVSQGMRSELSAQAGSPCYTIPRIAHLRFSSTVACGRVAVQLRPDNASPASNTGRRTSNVERRTLNVKEDVEEEHQGVLHCWNSQS